MWWARTAEDSCVTEPNATSPRAFTDAVVDAVSNAVASPAVFVLCRIHSDPAAGRYLGPPEIYFGYGLSLWLAVNAARHGLYAWRLRRHST